jgi:roadblock/LC7 domain-containing protein
MASHGELLKIDGVVAAGELGADGQLVDYKATMEMSSTSFTRPSWAS